jgi:hypothetical protein
VRRAKSRRLPARNPADLKGVTSLVKAIYANKRRPGDKPISAVKKKAAKV